MSGSKRTEQLCRQHIEHPPPLMSKTQKFPDSGGGAPSPGLKKSSGSRSAEQLELPTKKKTGKSLRAFQKPLRRGRAYWDLTEPLSLMENEEEVHWLPRLNTNKNGTPGRHLPVQETQVDSLDDQLENSAPDVE